MAEQKTEQKVEQLPKKHEREKERNEILVRIMSTDINGERNIYAGLTRIKGVSFAMSNAVCYILKLDKRRKISSLTKEEIEKISETIKNPKVPTFLLNRRFDYESGEDKHLNTNALDLQKEFDIKRLKKIKSYKGIRHSRGLPVRGQRTKSHFRKKGRNKSVGVQKKAGGK
jgi:small subunit ribosomal protein S13